MSQQTLGYDTDACIRMIEDSINIYMKITGKITKIGFTDIYIQTLPIVKKEKTLRPQKISEEQMNGVIDF